MKMIFHSPLALGLLTFFCSTSLCVGQAPVYFSSGITYDLSLSPAGTHLYTSGKGKIECLWIADGSSVFTYKSGREIPLIHLAVSRDTQFMVAASKDGELISWHSGQVNPAASVKLNSIPNTLCFLSGNRYLMAGLRDGRLLKLSIPGLEILENIKLSPGEITSIAVSDSTLMIAVAGANGKIWLFNNENLVCIDSIHAHRDLIRAIDFNSQGTNLYSCSDDSRVKGFLVGYRKITLVETKPMTNSLHWITSLDVQDNSQIVTSTPGGQLTIWTSRFRCKIDTKEQVYNVKFLPDKQLISICLATDKGIRIISNQEVASGKMKYF